MTSAAGAAGASVPAKVVVYPTNRFNVLHILGSGFVGPHPWYQKYYTDLLKWSPARLPLFEGAIPACASELVSAESEDAFPVALEIAADVLPDSGDPLLPEPGEEGGRAATSTWRALAFRGCFPIADVLRVHFRNASELEEFDAREYENIPPNLVPKVASPELFSGAGLSAERLKRWLEQQPKDSDLPGERFESLDRLLGALNVVAAACTGRQAELEWLKCLLTGIDMQPAAETPVWINRATLRGDRVKAQRGIPAADQKLFPIATAVLRHIYRAREWRPLEAIKEVEDRLTTVTFAKKDRADLDKALKRATALLRNEEAFRPFRAGSQMPAVKALIMVLMRPDPQAILEWPAEESGADVKTRLAAAAMVGSLWGHTRLPVGIRSASMDRLLSTVGLLELGEAAGGAPSHISATVDVQVEMIEATGEGRIGRLLWRGDEIISRPIPDSSLRRLCEAADPDALAAICERLGWNDCVDFTIELRGGAAAVATSEPEPQTTLLTGRGIPTLKLKAVRERVLAKVSEISDDSPEGSAIRTYMSKYAAGD